VRTFRKIRIVCLFLGGPIIQQECFKYSRQKGKLCEGDVMSTSAGSLNCKRVIHAVGPRWRNGNFQEEVCLSQCVNNCFEEAEKLNMNSIAIPPISTGIFGFPLELAVQIIVEVIENRDRNGFFLPQLVSLVDNKGDSIQQFEKELRKHFGDSTASQQMTQPASPPTSNSHASKEGISLKFIYLQ